VKDIDVNKLAQWVGLIVIAITTVISFNNLFHTVAEHEVRLKKIEEDDAVKQSDTAKQLVQLQKSIDYATWRIDALSKDFDKATVTKGTKR
jgi:hypothetical protein